MKGFIFLLLTILVFSTGCDLRQREELLNLKEEELNQKEQQLLLKEKSLQIKEEELVKRENLLDTSKKNLPDTLLALHPNIPGVWNVTMRCTETTCSGSAVGDTKTEQWDISFQNNMVIVKAMSDKQLLRSYSGTYVGNSFELSTQLQDQAPSPTAKIIVRLRPTKENEIEGRREIIRPEDCRIIYDLQLKKQ